MVPADCVVACHLLAAASGRALEGQKSSVSDGRLEGGFKGRAIAYRHRCRLAKAKQQCERAARLCSLQANCVSQ